VAHFQHHGREFHQGNIFGLSCLQTSYAEPLARRFLTYPTESILTWVVVAGVVLWLVVSLTELLNEREQQRLHEY
jgi:hypothetical protein